MEREHPKVIDTNLHLQFPPTNIAPGMRWNSRITKMTILQLLSLN